MFKWWRKREVQREEKSEEKPKEKSYLEKLCGDNVLLFEDLQHSLLLNPHMISETPEDFLSRGYEKEKKNDIFGARLEYAMAGRKALSELDPEKVRRCFREYRRLAGEDNQRFKYIAEHPEEAVEIARKYYEHIEKG